MSEHDCVIITLRPDTQGGSRQFALQLQPMVLLPICLHAHRLIQLVAGELQVCWQKPDLVGNVPYTVAASDAVDVWQILILLVNITTTRADLYCKAHATATHPCLKLNAKRC